MSMIANYCVYGVAHRHNAAGCLMNISNGEIAQTNVNVDKALEVGRGQLKQFDASWPDSYCDGCSSYSLGSSLTN